MEEKNGCGIKFSGVNYIDIDNDGVMEILVDVNSYAYNKVSIYKYHNNTVNGAVGMEFNPRSIIT
ncbi:MAG: hypothetical protein Q4G09_05945 [Clostridia bacterium]|nr:hypothetical protein [Clostridia bacterium]